MIRLSIFLIFLLWPPTTQTPNRCLCQGNTYADILKSLMMYGVDAKGPSRVCEPCETCIRPVFPYGAACEAKQPDSFLRNTVGRLFGGRDEYDSNSAKCALVVGKMVPEWGKTWKEKCEAVPGGICVFKLPQPLEFGAKCKPVNPDPQTLEHCKFVDGENPVPSKCLCIGDPEGRDEKGNPGKSATCNKGDKCTIGGYRRRIRKCTEEAGPGTGEDEPGNTSMRSCKVAPRGSCAVCKELFTEANSANQAGTVESVPENAKKCDAVSELSDETKCEAVKDDDTGKSLCVYIIQPALETKIWPFSDEKRCLEWEVVTEGDKSDHPHAVCKAPFSKRFFTGESGDYLPQVTKGWCTSFEGQWARSNQLLWPTPQASGHAL